MKNIALFDFDGTIATIEMLLDFSWLAIPRCRQRIVQILLAPLIIGYKIGIISGSVVRAAIVRLWFSGVPYEHYKRKGRE